MQSGERDRVNGIAMPVNVDPRPAGTDAGSSTGASVACMQGESPDPGNPLRYSACIIVEDHPGFCADGVFAPECVDGTWQCTGNKLPEEMCAQSGDPCELDSTT